MTLAARHFGATLRLIEAAGASSAARSARCPGWTISLAIPRRISTSSRAASAARSVANARAHRVSFERSRGAPLGDRSRAIASSAPASARQPRAAAPARALTVELRQKRSELLRSARRLRLEPLRERVAVVGRRLAETSERSRNAFRQDVERRLRRVMALDQLLRSLSYENVLARGYAVVRDASYTPIPSKAGLTSGAALDIQFRDGHIGAVAGPALPRPRRKKSDPGDQGSLF